MRIAFLTELFPPNIGGQEIRFAELADLLADRGHEITVLCVRHAKELPAEEHPRPGITIIRTPEAPRYRRPRGRLLPRDPLAVLRYAMAARRLAYRHSFDVLFLNQWPLLHVLALPAAARQRAVLDWCEIRTGNPYRWFQSLLPRLVAANTAVSTDVEHHLRRQLAESEHCVHLLPSGVRLDRYSSGCEAATQAGAPGTSVRSGLLYLGRLTPHKCPGLLVETFEALRRRGYQGSLTIAGDGPSGSELRARTTASPAANAIRLTGAVSESEKLRLLAAAEVLLLPSQREGFPRVVAEAMASGLPTVTTLFPQNGTVGVVREFGCGLCAEPSPDALAESVLAVLRDRPAFAERARAGSARLDWNAVVDGFEALLCRVAARPARGHLGSGDFDRNGEATCVSS